MYNLDRAVVLLVVGSMRMETAGCLNNTNYTDTGPRDLHVADMS